MSLGDLLEQIRDHHISQFVDFIRAQRQVATCVHEAALCNSEGEVVNEGLLSLPIRCDLLIIRDGIVSDSLQFDTAQMLSFEPITFAWVEDVFKVALAPFQWNWLQLRVYGVEANSDWTPFRKWFIDWFREHDPGDDELLGGVHFASDPESHAGFCEIAIDLGTAPVEAFEELLDAIGELKAERVEIGQFSAESSI